jgi:hypothetical protein
MPGSFDSHFLLAFALDGRNQPVPAFEPRPVASASAGLEEAEAIRRDFAGVVVWRRHGTPAIGEEGEPEVLFSAGRIGDFN